MSISRPNGWPEWDIKRHVILINRGPIAEGDSFVEGVVPSFATGQGDSVDTGPTKHYFRLVNPDLTPATDVSFAEANLPSGTVPPIWSNAPGFRFEWGNAEKNVAVLVNEHTGLRMRNEYVINIYDSRTARTYSIGPGMGNGDGDGGA